MHGFCIPRALLEHFREEKSQEAGTDKSWKIRLKERECGVTIYGMTVVDHTKLALGSYLRRTVAQRFSYSICHMLV